MLDPIALPPTRSPLVLIVDDQPQIRDMAGRLLSLLGYRVIGANDEQEAEVALDRHRDQLAIAIVDLFLGPGSAAGLAQRLEREHAGLPVLFMSGYCREICEAMSLLGPDRDFIEKPFSISQLAKAISTLLLRSAMAEENVHAG